MFHHKESVASNTRRHIAASARRALPLAVTLETLLTGTEVQRWQ
jgi:hypothetical protein